MTTIFPPQRIRAQAIKDGQDVYLTDCDGWSANATAAELITTQDDADFRLNFARRLREVINAELIAT
jgi:hypothetical protein